MIRKQSFISDILGENDHSELKEIAKLISLVGTVILIVLYTLSHCFHSDIIRYFIELTNGTSLLFIGYILSLILTLDIEVSIDEPEHENYKEITKTRKPFKYKLTIIWGVLLIGLGIAAIYYSEKYRNQYVFECETYLVDEKAGIYHLDWDVDCGFADEAEKLIEMKGFQIPKSFKFCEGCEEMLKEAESETALLHLRP